jgi:hypothetical protein
MTRTAFFTIIFLSASHLAYAGDENAADAMIAKGLELRREGKGLDALEMFEKANAIAPSPRSSGQLGLAESAVEHWSDAEAHLTVALANPEDPWVRKNHGALDQALTLVGTHIGQIALEGAPGAAVVISGKSAGTLPLAKSIRVNAGPAIVTATAAGFKLFEMSVPVEAGKETQLKIILEPIQLSPAPAAVAATTPAPASSLPGTDLHPHSWRTWTGGTLLGVGGAAAAWGIVWIALDGHSASGSCTAGAPAGCSPVYNTKTAGIVLAGAGVATAVVGGILLYTARDHDAEVGVAVGPSSLVLGGRF